VLGQIEGNYLKPQLVFVFQILSKNEGSDRLTLIKICGVWPGASSSHL
jgi:hypothetical protein